jgi:superfamily II DNA or RNA helicase
LENWEENGFRGVVSFATGAGKTIVALRGAKQWAQTGKPVLILVPTQELHRQWLDEIAIELPGVRALQCGAGSGPSDWGDLLAIYSQEEPISDLIRIVLCTNATFMSDAFLSRLQQGDHLLVIADEMHRLGSPKALGALASLSAGASLGLTATYRRQFDESGTAALLNWFGPILEPVVGLAEAILLELLVPYDYRFHTLELEPDELLRYEQLTDRIKRFLGRGVEDSESLEVLTLLLIQRARILKQARGKAAAAAAILAAEYEDGDRWLVYCDDTQQLNEVVRQGLQLGLPVLEYHSMMASDRGAAMTTFKRRGGVVVAIRCLDEGVDIPDCNRALILASSTAEREYVQRRGRVLRTAPGKVSATVHDLLLVDAHGGVLARSEAVRAIEFARTARNPGARAQLRLIIARSADPNGLPMVDQVTADENSGDEAP